MKSRILNIVPLLTKKKEGNCERRTKPHIEQKVYNILLNLITALMLHVCAFTIFPSAWLTGGIHRNSHRQRHIFYIQALLALLSSPLPHI